MDLVISNAGSPYMMKKLGKDRWTTWQWDDGQWDRWTARLMDSQTGDETDGQPDWL